MVIKDFRPSITEVAPLMEELIDSGKKVKLAVTGCSMYPLLFGGDDTVTLEKAVSVNKYDVILFKRRTGKFVLHRVLKVKDGAYVIAGDNEIKKEYPVYPDEVVAKMSTYVRRGKVHSVKGIRFRIFSRFWVFVFPLRRIITHMFLNPPVCGEDDD